MAESEYYNRAIKAYNDFLESVFREVKNQRRAVIENLSPQEQKALEDYVDVCTCESYRIKPAGTSYVCDYFSKISEKEYLDYLEKEYKNIVIQNSIRYEKVPIATLINKAVSKIIDMDRIKLNKILEIL